MAITFVASQTSETSSVNDLVIAMPAGLQQDDVVVVLAATRNTTNDTWSEGSGTWTLVADLFSSDSRVTNFSVFLKRMGASPDTSVTITQDGAAAGMVGIASAYRGVDTVTAQDAVAITATGINSSNANPGSITTVTDDALVIACGGASAGATPIMTAPSGYSDSTLFDTTVTNMALMIASKIIVTAGAEDPGAFNVSTSGTSDSWCAVTIALKPASGSVNNTLTAATTSFTLTGTATSFKVARKLTAATATYTLTGIAVTLTNGTGEVETTSVSVNLSFGMGPMGKPSVHPHPQFSRHKQ